MTPTSTRLPGLALLAASIVLSAVGQLCMKAGMQALHGIVGVSAYTLTLDTVTTLRVPIVWTAAGLLAYGSSLLCWLAVLVRYPLSFAYPLLSLSYVLVYVGATHWTLLAEQASSSRTLGTLLILVGVSVVSLSERSGPRSNGSAQHY